MNVAAPLSPGVPDNRDVDIGRMADSGQGKELDFVILVDST